MNLSPDEVQRFYLRSRAADALEAKTHQEPASIVLVEDNPADAGLVREALEEHDIECELIVISDGELAVAFIQSVAADETPCPDLVILDLNLPKLPGREVLRYIRASSKCMHVPVVVLTSSDAIQDREDAAFLGASRYIRKPLRLREFLSVGGVIKEIIADHSK